jgi:hypothetical protein
LGPAWSSKRLFEIKVRNLGSFVVGNEQAIYAN